MIKILFICHGNICRSPMAEFLLKDIVKKRIIIVITCRSIVGHTLEAVSSRLCKGTESDLVLAAYSLPSQFQHTLDRKSVV